MATASESWAVWLVIILFLVVCVGLIIWFAIDNNIPHGIRDSSPPQTVTQAPAPISEVAVSHVVGVNPMPE